VEANWRVGIDSRLVGASSNDHRLASASSNGHRPAGAPNFADGRDARWCQNLELKLKKFKLVREQGPRPEQKHKYMSRSKSQSESTPSAQSWRPDHSLSSRVSCRQKPKDGRDVRRSDARKGGI